jgi:hypothetical protein
MFRRRVLAGRVWCVERTDGTWRCVSRTLQFCTGWALAAALFGGCHGDRGPERVVVSGTVTYNGKPVAVGKIRFVAGSTSSVPISAAEIADGKYAADTHGGVAVGTYKVQIEAFRRIGNHAQSDERLPPGIKDRSPYEQYLPAKYNTSTKLEIAIPSGSRTITKDFDLRD